MVNTVTLVRSLLLRNAWVRKAHSWPQGYRLEVWGGAYETMPRPSRSVMGGLREYVGCGGGDGCSC